MSQFEPERPPSNKIGWIVGGLVIVLIVLVALQAIVRGTGEAVGVGGMAPNGSNASPAPGATGG